MEGYDKIITIIGILLIVTYSLVQIFKFYGITFETYIVYITFYLFLFLCIFLFPKYYNN